MSNPPDPQPSDEAIEAARKTMSTFAMEVDWSPRSSAALGLTAAYAIDMPRREAETRAATIRDLQTDAALNVAAEAFENRVGTTPGVGDGMRAALDVLAAHLDPEAE